MAARRHSRSLRVAPSGKFAGGAGLIVAFSMTAAGCGGGGAATAAGAGPAEAPVAYANSVALGNWAPQSVAYVGGTGATPAQVITQGASALLANGASSVLADHSEASVPGALEVCVSGNGESTNIVAPIDVGVVAQSAAVLLDDSWTPVPDAVVAWTALARRQAVFVGWENCGVKPEGPPSPSSLLTVQTDAGYAEDIYDGNPGTNYNVITEIASAAQVSAMLGPQGWATVADPARPMQLFLRIYSNRAGQQLMIEMGMPRSTAPASLKGFISMYLPQS